MDETHNKKIQHPNQYTLPDQRPENHRVHNCVFRAGRAFFLFFSFLFFFNDTATTEIYTLSLHDALPISYRSRSQRQACRDPHRARAVGTRSEEHTSELQSRRDLVCRLLLEKKKKTT